MRTDEVRALLAETYARVTDAVRDPASWHRPTGTEAWDVHELLLHLLLDARRTLVALATPADGAPDTDRVTYWDGFKPGDTDAARAHVAYVRQCAAAYASPSDLVAEWDETSRAAAHACRVAEPDVVTSQGHALTVDDLVHTLLVEATIHLLDLTTHLPDAAGPPPEALAEVRRLLESLARGPLPAGWDDRTAALKATGRGPLTEADRAALGDRAGRLPVLG